MSERGRSHKLATRPVLHLKQTLESQKVEKLGKEDSNNERKYLLEKTIYEVECGEWLVDEQKFRDNPERVSSKIQVEGERVADLK